MIFAAMVMTAIVLMTDTAFFSTGGCDEDDDDDNDENVNVDD